MAETVECVQCCAENYGDDWLKWPEPYRLAVEGARRRFLDRNPEIRIVGERSYILPADDPRYPFGHPMTKNWPHVHIFEMNFERPAAEEQQS